MQNKGNGGLIQKKNNNENQNMLNDSSEQVFFENSDGENTRLMKVAEAAKMLGLTERALRLMIYRNEVPLYRIGKRIRFKKCDLERWLSRQFVSPRGDQFPPILRR